MSEALAVADPAEATAIRRELVLSHLASADAVARRYRGRGIDEQDLVQVARLGLVEAAARYDPGLGSFLAFAIPTMTGMIRRHFRDRGWSVKPPRSIQEQFPRLSQARQELAHELLRWPTTPEVAARLSLSAEQVQLTRQADGCFQTSSLDAFVGPRPEPLGERLPEPEDRYAVVEQQLILEPAWRQLSDRDRRVVYLRFYDELSQREIAEEFGVSQMQISRWLIADPGPAARHRRRNRSPRRVTETGPLLDPNARKHAPSSLSKRGRRSVEAQETAHTR